MKIWYLYLVNSVDSTQATAILVSYLKKRNLCFSLLRMKLEWIWRDVHLIHIYLSIILQIYILNGTTDQNVKEIAQILRKETHSLSSNHNEGDEYDWIRREQKNKN